MKTICFAFAFISFITSCVLVSDSFNLGGSHPSGLQVGYSISQEQIIVKNKGNQSIELNGPCYQETVIDGENTIALVWLRIQIEIYEGIWVNQEKLRNGALEGTTMTFLPTKLLPQTEKRILLPQRIVLSVVNASIKHVRIGVLLNPNEDEHNQVIVWSAPIDVHDIIR